MRNSQRVKWFSDNANVCIIVKKRSIKVDLQELAYKIFEFCTEKSIHL